MDIGNFLRQLGLSQYEAALRENAIDAEVLARLTPEDLKDLGITLVGHRRRLLEAVAALQAQAPHPESVPDPSTTGRGKTTARTTVLEAERRQLTVMFCDLVGSTALSARLDPEDLREVIGRYHACVAETVTRFDGFVAKFMGDGVIAYFGYPQAHEDDTEQAIRAGLALVDAVGTLQVSERLGVRIGMATGIVIVGDLIGAGSAQEQAVIGETPNLAARLQALAEPNSIVIAESTRRQIGALFEVADLGPQSLKGFADPLCAWRVLSENRRLGRFEALRSRATPLVGRKEERRLLLRRWRQAKQGSGHAVLISGEPGVGKSRITEALCDRIATESHIWLRYFCYPHHQDSALHPFIVQWERAAGFAPGDARETKLAKLRSLLAAAMPSAEDLALIAELCSLPATDLTPPLDGSPESRKEKTFEALLGLMERFSRQRPVLMIFEDLHWIDPSSRELLDRIIGELGHWPVLMLATFRPEFQPVWVGQPNVTTLTLGRLDRRSTEALIENVACNRLLPTEIVQEIARRTEGVPLFAEELTKAVLESDTGGLAALPTVPRPALTVPVTLHASLMARLDRLGAAAKDVAQKGAVIGREFTYGLLASIADLPQEQLREALDDLADSGLLFTSGTPPQSRYMFKHALVQDTAYGMLLRARRQALHLRVGAALGTHSAVTESNPELLAHHFTLAECADQALPHWLRAGQIAAMRSANMEAIAHLRRGIDVLERLPASVDRDRQELAFQTALGPVLVATKGYSATETVNAYRRAWGLIESTKEAENEDAVFTGLFISHYNLAEFSEGLAIAEGFLRRVEADTETGPRCIAHRTVAASCNSIGDFPKARRHAELALALYDPDRHGRLAWRFAHDIGVAAMCHLAIAQFHCGYIDQSARMAARALATARRLRHANTLGYALFYAGVLPRYNRREFTLLLDHARNLAAHGHKHGQPQWTAWGLCFQAPALIAAGRATEAKALVRSGISACDAIQNYAFRPAFLGFLGAAQLALGQVDQALEAASKALLKARCTRECWIVPELLELLARACPEDNRPKAEQELQEAIACARSQGSLPHELRASIRLGVMWSERGMQDAARRLVEAVYDRFREGWDVPDLKEGRELLDQLTCSEADDTL